MPLLHKNAQISLNFCKLRGIKMDEKDKIEKVAKEFGEIIVTKKIKERITYCGLMDCLKREKIEEEIDIKVIKKK